MKPIAEMTQVELAAFVQFHLRKKDVSVILSGGASVAFYSDNQYVSADLDLICTLFTKQRAIEEVMQRLGFSQKGRYFTHPDTAFFVEFPPGPLSVGKEPVHKIEEYELETGILKIISPTDCVKDRLLGYFYWGDRQSLQQAILVAQMNPIDLAEIERWATKEGKLSDFGKIREQLIRP